VQRGENAGVEEVTLKGELSTLKVAVMAPASNIQQALTVRRRSLVARRASDSGGTPRPTPRPVLR
jgi:hypothetical protein